MSPSAHRGLTWGVSLKSGNHLESLSLRGDRTNNKANSSWVLFYMQETGFSLFSVHSLM